MLTLIISRHSQTLLSISEILEFDLDGIRLSGVEYFVQEAREAQITLLYDAPLQELLAGSQMQVLAGWHALAWRLYQDNRLVWQGFLPQGGYGLKWLSPTVQSCELQLVDLLGLILALAEKVKYRLEGSYIDPARQVCAIISEVIAPCYAQEDVDIVEVNALRAALGPFNWQFAYLGFDYSLWLPYNLYRHILIDSAEYWLHGSFGTDTRRFGYAYDGTELRLVLWQYCKRADPDNYLEVWRWRTWSLNGGSINLVESRDLISEDYAFPLSNITPCPPLAELVLGIGNYRLEDGKAMYSGPGSLQSVEVVPGDYQAKELIGEYLRLLNAVLVVSNYSLEILNRLDIGAPILEITDLIEADLSTELTEPPEITAVSLASQAIIDGVNKHYKKLLTDYPWELEIITHRQLLGELSEAELLRRRIRWQGYELMPGECSLDLESGEVSIRGRARGLC